MQFHKYFFTPRLIKQYDGSKISYEPGALEKYGDQLLTALNLMWSFSYYTSPILVSILYRRGYFVAESVGTFAKVTTGIGLLVAVSLCMRGLGRSMNVAYVRFAETLENAKRSSARNGEAKKALRQYDFDFSHWPVDYVTSRKTIAKPNISASSPHRSHPDPIPCHVAAYIAVHTFGIRMIYPGSVRLLQSYMEPMIVEGRTKLVKQFSGERNKLRTTDGNEIDTIFVDYRHRTNQNANGATLVICSEGNASFYEIGIMSTPLELKYSVLGWNHPGFAGSSGRPYPDQDQNAIDAVLQFAIGELGFKPENIILYGWSIGGYSTLYGASLYPEVKGVILDATFDDVLELALPRMPESISNIVRIAIREYVNLNNRDLITEYPGPVLFIRRTEDEIICSEENDLATNRGNFLLINMLQFRFPYIFKSEQVPYAKELLSKPIELMINDTDLTGRLMDYVGLNTPDGILRYPLQIGNEADFSSDSRRAWVRFLITKHLSDFKSTHCTPLPKEFFQSPWELPSELDYYVVSHDKTRRWPR